MTAPPPPGGLAFEDFERRLLPVLWKQPETAPDLFTADEVAAYVTEKAARPYHPGYIYEDLLRAFPRAWWLDSLEAALRARPEKIDDHARAGGARSLINAWAAIAPGDFAQTAHLLAGWDIHLKQTMGVLTAHRAAAAAGLRRMLADPDDPWRWRAAGYLLLLEPDAEPEFAQVIAAAPERAQYAAESALQRLGYLRKDGALRRMWPRASYHLSFPADYLLERDAGAPFTIRDPAAAPLHAIGGFVPARSHKGKAITLQHVITLDPVPADLGVTLPKLTLVIALHAADDDGTETYYVHRPDGTFEAHVRLYDWDFVRYQDHPAIRPGLVQLVPSPDALRFQAWGEQNTGQSLFRLGGLPVFVQAEVFPRCLRCEQPMVHLLSLDSGLPLDGKTEYGHPFLDWGSGGVANAFWCDACRVSAWTWACT